MPSLFNPDGLTTLTWSCPKQFHLDLERLWGSNSTQTSNCIGFSTAQISTSAIPILSIFNSPNNISFPISKGRSPTFQALIKQSSNKSNSCKHFSNAVRSTCKRIMLNQSGQPVVATFGCKRMDGVVKRRHMKYASLCSLLNLKFRSVTSSDTGSSEQFIRALSLLFYLDGTLPQTNKVYHRAFDLNQKCSKYLGSASNHRRGCQNFPPIIQGRHMCGSSLNAKLSRHRWVQWLENTFYFNYDPV